MNLLKRTISAIILIPLVIYIITNGGLLLKLLAIIIAIISAYEWNNFTAKTSNKIRWKIIGIFYISLPCLSILYLEQIEWSLFILFIAVWCTDIGGYI
jgi:phosphatidate cytidylyltransferase